VITLNIIAQPTAVTPNPLALSAQRAAPRFVTTVLPDAQVLLLRPDRIPPSWSDHAANRTVACSSRRPRQTSARTTRATRLLRVEVGAWLEARRAPAARFAISRRFLYERLEGRREDALSGGTVL